MNKILLLILIFLFLNNCSSNKDPLEQNEKKTNLQNNQVLKKNLNKKTRNEQELNPTLEVNISNGEFTKNFDNNKNDLGELEYQGLLEKLGKYNYAKFNDFKNIEVKPILMKILFFLITKEQ